MTTRILICIAVSNRARLAEACIKTVADTLFDHNSGQSLHGDVLTLWDDGSTDSANLGFFADEVHRAPKNIGIEAMRRNHFRRFENAIVCGSHFSHLYLTDADAPHDPCWREELLRLQEAHGGAPICGYNTQSHARIEGNTIIDDPASEVIWRRAAPGVSHLLTAGHVAKVCDWLSSNPQTHWHWDWTVPAILGHRFAVTRTSYVSHIGKGGYHHPESEGWDGGDVPLNPTPWLIAKRAEIVAKLKEGA